MSPFIYFLVQIIVRNTAGAQTDRITTTTKNEGNIAIKRPLNEDSVINTDAVKIGL